MTTIMKWIDRHNSRNRDHYRLQDLPASQASQPSHSGVESLKAAQDNRSIVERFPPEIVLEILDHLDDCSIICLKCTNRHFYLNDRFNSAKLSRCAKWLVMVRFEQDVMLDERRWREVKRFTCCECKSKRIAKDFIGIYRRCFKVGRKSKYDHMQYSLICKPATVLLT